MDKETRRKLANTLPYDIEVFFWKHTETLACGYMGIRCGENTNTGDSYRRISREIAERLIALGWCKLPKGKPPMVTEGMNFDHHPDLKPALEAQREADIKFYKASTDEVRDENNTR